MKREKKNAKCNGLHSFLRKERVGSNTKCKNKIKIKINNKIYRKKNFYCCLLKNQDEVGELKEIVMMI